MYRITDETVIDGDLATVWSVVTDVDNWRAWDPHEEDARIDGEFAAGATGWSKPHGAPGATWTITDVVEGRSWASQCALPGGRLVGENTFEALGDGRIRCVKSVHVYGPLVPLFRLYFGRRIRRDMSRTFAALEREAARRAATAA
ncbi:hypothetical protein F0L68_05440 [Solihabitans fulvus]|uniref:Polyketide cyclase / dehydrase and lipid transport n=1 Tax=Solihabitans fulvus TaxID=1892852 RepID=A0A5B2XQ98_9PSEU|nr:SRPBCC family protein [Solihabitans fulvus]KAA2265104.1 hypothetical protein F0L68_05440 [Solihabitans fulvus]